MKAHATNLLAKLLAAALPLALVSGCQSYADRVRDARDLFHAGALEQAAQTLDREMARRKRSDADVLRLERAMVDLAAGRPREAELALREVRDSFDHLEQKSAAESALVMLADDNSRAYSGEDYEKVLVRAMLAISNLMVDGQDASAYSLQVADKQQQIIQTGADPEGANPKLAYKQVALGPYLHGMLREETHVNYDDVERAAVTVASWEPDFAFGRQDLERARHGRHSQPGHGVLYVFAFVGEGPHKEQVAEVASSVSLLIADRILSYTGSHTLPPTIAPVMVPLVVRSPQRVRDIGVAIDGAAAGSTATLTDIGKMAVDQYAAIYPQVVARAVVRRVVKKGIVYATKEATGVENNTWLNLAVDAAGVVWEATESADTRSWSLLPDRIQVLRLEMPAGTHRVDLYARTSDGSRGEPASQIVHMADGRNTYLLANFPDVRPVGKILTR